MSGSKRLLEDLEADRQWAESMLLDAGALKECELHGYLVDQMDSSAFEDAVLAGRQESSENEEAIRHKLQNVLNDYGDECPGCEANAAD
ncbi:hypothetical protein EFQ99_00040 [Rhizobium vallis]|uniref:Uncharacterized protein n=2 Tax=Rhizobium vallis TaxID=634290 RepID=A0A432PS50_9HYPH|nr:hypothetical protein EFQ99_00040 [Rhizobium vallis]